MKISIVSIAFLACNISISRCRWLTSNLLYRWSKNKDIKKYPVIFAFLSVGIQSLQLPLACFQNWVKSRSLRPHRINILIELIFEFAKVFRINEAKVLRAFCQFFLQNILSSSTPFEKLQPHSITESLPNLTTGTMFLPWRTVFGFRQTFSVFQYLQ